MSEPVVAIEHLDGKGLVELPKANIVDTQAKPLEKLGHGEDRADTHFVGLGTRDGHSNIAAERIQATFFRE